MTTNRIVKIAQEGDNIYQGYLALPAAGHGPGLLIPPEIYGVVPDIRALADRFAARGYVALAPDILWRDGAGKEYAYADREKAASVLGRIGGVDPVAEEIATAFSALRALEEVDGKAGLVTFGFGTVPTLIATISGSVSPDAGVTFFGGRITDLENAAAIKAPWQFHYAEEDAVILPTIIDATREAFADRPDVEIYSYPGTSHGFAIAGRSEFDAKATDAAFERVDAFLSTHLRN